MKNLRKLGAALVLTFALGLQVFAGQTDTPPCTQPGQTDTPPCAAAPGDLETPGALTAPTLASSETSLSEIAANIFLNFLPLF